MHFCQSAVGQCECTFCCVLGVDSNQLVCAFPVFAFVVIMGDEDNTIQDVPDAGMASMEDAQYGQLKPAPYGERVFADPDFGGKWVLCDIVTQETVVLEPEEAELDVICDDSGSEAFIRVLELGGGCLCVCSAFVCFCL